MRCMSFCICLLTVGGLFGQGNLEIASANADGRVSHGQLYISVSERAIEGSPYINEVYKQGETIMFGKVRRKALMRYDAYRDAVEIMGQDQRPRTLLRRNTITAQFDGRTYKVMEYVDLGRSKQGYFNPLNQGTAQLLFKPKKRFRQAENPDHGYDTYDPPQFIDDSSYYLKWGNRPAVKIQLGKKKLLKALGSYSPELRKFISKNKLSMKKEEDVVRLVKYFNTLVESSSDDSPYAALALGR